MIRIVLDTNILIASIFWSGTPYLVVQQALDKKLEIFASKAILNEVRKVLKDSEEDFQLSEQETDDIINGILLYAKIIEPKHTPKIVKQDPKDDPIIACALETNAHYIISRDKHLLTLKEHAKTKIVTPEEFLKHNRV